MKARLFGWIRSFFERELQRLKQEAIAEARREIAAQIDAWLRQAPRDNDLREGLFRVKGVLERAGNVNVTHLPVTVNTFKLGKVSER